MGGTPALVVASDFCRTLSYASPDAGVEEGAAGMQPGWLVGAAQQGASRLGALPADAARQLDVLGHDGHALGVDGAQHARRKTVTALDVVYALKRQGRALYGFGG
ncbi:Histone H4 [Tetrabaena socialis]|uniref:Histone H4 n=1 Tax=Tetrabaena socialis TaxID=47790 RepID=A0A2J7ZJ90_9CHLO|nr:Histone H4 [Tetrabaena socialis]|eukprot:PNH00334.1 Histone H4 [Tetrabaena socialis]